MISHHHNRKSKKKEQKKGSKHYVSFYSQYYGKRWNNLLSCMQLKQKKHICLLNKYYFESKSDWEMKDEERIDSNSETKQTRYQNMVENAMQHLESILQDCDDNIVEKNCNNNEKQLEHEYPFESVPYLCLPCLKRKQSTPMDKFLAFPSPVKSIQKNDTINYYLLDGASVLAVQALGIEPNDQVLDMCAAPGGKSIVALQYLKPVGAGGLGTLHCNEYDQERQKRLRKVIRDYVPLAVWNGIVITEYNGSLPNCFKNSQYDKIIVDAPCSSDGHIVNNQDELAKWSVELTKQFSETQYRLGISALRALKYGGRMIYITCSISPYENDQVVDRLLHNKFGIACKLVENGGYPIGEKTKLGWIVLPDNNNNNHDHLGPLYFSVIEKCQKDDESEEDQSDGTDSEEDDLDSA